MLLLLTATPPVAVADQAVRMPRGAADMDSLARMRKLATQARGVAASNQWFALAQFSLSRAYSLSSETNPKDPWLSGLKEACAHLLAPDLAAVAGLVCHPTISEAMVRTLLRDEPLGTGESRAEAAAEARDAIRRFGPGRTRYAVDALRRATEPAAGAGPSIQSVFRVDVLAPRDPDSTGVAHAIHAGLLAGIKAGAGARADRFMVRSKWPSEDDPMLSDILLREALEGGTGVVLVAGGASLWAKASTLAQACGFVAVDARSRADVPPEQQADGPEYYFGPPGAPRQFRYVTWMGGYNESLEIRGYVGNGSGEPRISRPLTLRPPDFERARRLALALRGNSRVHRVAIAVPESGPGFGFATCFEHACRALKLPVAQIDYMNGVRDYTPEVARFDSTGADAILLAGSGAESAEWLLALAKRGRKPLVLGDLELDPAGFHDRARAAVEGAILVGDEWSDWPKTAVALRAAADSAGYSGSADFARAFAFGQVLGTEVAAGAFTPTSLLRALRRDSLPRIYGASDWNWLGATTPGPSNAVREVPLWVVRNGRLEAWSPPR